MWKFFAGTQRDLKARPGRVATARKRALESRQKWRHQAYAASTKAVRLSLEIFRLLELSFLCPRERHQSVKSLAQGSGRGLRVRQMCERVPWELGRSSCLLFY